MESTLDYPNPHQALLPHAHLASLDDGLDFVNTLEYGRAGEEEHLDSVEKALEWLYDHQLLHREALDEALRRYREDGAAEASVMQRIRRVRSAMRELVDAAVERRPPDSSQLKEVNRVLRTHYIYELVPAPDGVSLDHRHEGDPINGALARLAESVAREVSQGDPERLRICANEDCRWVFFDTSRTGRRKWCDMSTCGNRAKAARHRERRKVSGQVDLPDHEVDEPVGNVDHAHEVAAV